MYTIKTEAGVYICDAYTSGEAVTAINVAARFGVVAVATKAK